MPTSADTVTIQVPGSTSNIGPGFDCLGIALSLYNRITVTRDGANPHPPHAMVRECARLFFRRTRAEEFGFAWSIDGDVPVSRGLGSSVTVRLGILAALNELSGQPLSHEGLFALCSEIEGHPDNAGPAAFGGFLLTNAKGEFFRFPVEPCLKFVLLIPEMEVLTENARRVLPPSIPVKEAVVNLGNACSITAAFATAQYEKLRDCFDDFLHQPYRAHLVPGLFEVIEAGVSVGALGGFLSGSGSAICCVTLAGNENHVATAMRHAFPDPSRAVVRIVVADNGGTRRLSPA
ncbi:MAG: homoserine kinase [Verrucomicrobiales bacterium]|nr:homoserine kinase [Verrucomicrobiales bacterium]